MSAVKILRDSLKLFTANAILALTIVIAPVATAATSISAPASISPEAQAYLNQARVGAIDGGDMSDPASLNRMRSALGNMFLRAAMKIDPDMYLTEQALGSVNGYWVNSKAPEQPGPVIIYLHGGGHILGSAKTNLGSAIRLRRASKLPILSIEYRLAPEYPFPANIDDAVAAYRWLLKAGFAAEQIGVYGDSAGGGLSLAMTLALAAENLPRPAAVAVLSPSADYVETGDTRITLRDTDPIIRTSPGRALYVGSADVNDPLLSPIYADYTDFPPLLIQVGTREVLLSDSIQLARRARAAGADVTLDIWDGMWHGWHDQPDIPEAEQACQELASFFVKHLGGTALGTNP